MRRLLLLALLFMPFGSFLNAQVIYSGFLEEGFEATTFPPANWQRVNIQGTNVWNRSTAQAHSGSASAYMQYQTTMAEDWLIMPKFQVGATDSLSFWMRLAYSGYPPDSLSIKLSTTDSITSSFTKTLLHLREGVNYPPNATTWYQYKVSLAAYAGQTVYLAFKHFNSNGDGLYIDDVKLGTLPNVNLSVLSINNVGFVSIAGTSPQVSVKNNGGAAQSFTVGLTTSDGYNQSMPVTNLAAGATQLVNFPLWTPAPGGTYTITASINQPGDADTTDNSLTTTVNVYNNFTNNGWTTQAPLPSARWGNGLASKTNASWDTASLFLISGSDASFAMTPANSQFNSQTAAWTTAAPIPVARLQVSAQTIGNKIYVAGGYTSGFSPTSRLDIYDISTNSWSQGTNMPTAVGDYALGVYGDSLLYIIGGYNGSGDVNTVQVYNVNTNTWAIATAKPGTAAAGIRGGIAEGKIVVAGGYNQTLFSLNDAWLGTINPADPTQISWSAIPDLPFGATSRHGAGALFEKVYFTSGDPNGAGATALSATAAYNVASGMWELGPNKPTGVSNISNLTPVLQNGQAYMVAMGGYNGVGVVTANEWLSLGAYCTLAGSISKTNVSCNGVADGTATIAVTGARGAYSYSWNTTPEQITATATGLAAGTYTVTVSDAFGCKINETVTITEPAVLAAAIPSPTQLPCNGGSNGAVLVNATGGTTPYGYSWSNGASSQEATGLAGGSYTVTVTDSNSCQATASVTLESRSLTGTLTVNQALPASSTNFHNFSTLASSLNTCGLVGPLTIDITPGTGPYTDKLLLEQIPGSSVTNTLTINGNGNTLTGCFGHFFGKRDMIRLDGTDNITINGFVLDGSMCGDAWGVHLLNGNENVTISNNTILHNAAYSIYAANHQGIIAANSFNATGAMAGILNNITITGNTINNGYAAIRINGNSSDWATNVTIANNILTGAAMHGIVTSYTNNLSVTGNQLNLRNVNPTQDIHSIGIQISYAENGLAVTGNKVANSGKQALFLNYVNEQSATRGTIANNMLGGGFRFSSPISLQLNFASYLDVYFNSLNTDFGTGLGLYVSNTKSRNLRVMNNSIAYTGASATGRAMSAAGGFVNFTQLNYNNYYSTGQFVVFNNAVRNSLAELQASMEYGTITHDQNSVSVDPEYVSATDLHLSAATLNGMGTSINSITTDFDGQARPTPPSIGADEFTAPPRMAGVANQEISVYPNPFRNELSVELKEGKAEVVLIDLLGREVFRSGFTSTGAPVTITPNQQIAEGVYILQVTQNNITSQTRVVKQ